MPKFIEGIDEGIVKLKAERAKIASRIRKLDPDEGEAQAVELKEIEDEINRLERYKRDNA